MSGAALFAGPYLVGVVAANPSRYGTGRLLATPITAVSGDPDWRQRIGVAGTDLMPVGSRFRLAVTTDLSLVLLPAYTALPPGLDLAAAPVQLLLPEHGIVPFLGRELVLEDLQDWCSADRRLGLRLLAGVGGAGKTRLAAELCVRMQGVGWDVGFADTLSPGGENRLELEHSTLLVVDEADLTVELIAGVVKRLAYQTNGPRLRLLMLARHRGSWWDQLNMQTSGLADGYAAPPLSLDVDALSAAQRKQHRDNAVRAFAAQLQTDHLAPGLPAMTDPVFANPLVIHMTVLLALLGDIGVDVADGDVRERVLRGLLRRERQRWASTLRGAGLGDLGSTIAAQAVSLATLTSPDSRADTIQLLPAIPDLHDASRERLGSIADWLHELYPGVVYVTPLRPDLLAEQHLSDTPELAQLTIGAYDRVTSTAQVIQSLAELTSAAQSQSTVRTVLAQLLDARLSGLVGQAITEPGTPIPGLIALALRVSPMPENDPSLAERLTALGAALIEAGQLDQAAHAIDHAERVATAIGADRLAAHAKMQRLLLDLRLDLQRATAEVGRVLPGVLQVFERYGDQLGLCRAWRLRAAMHWNRANSGAAEAGPRQSAGVSVS
jgi:hypothetical protein